MPRIVDIQIIKIFGEEILTQGNIDRKKLAKIVFKNKKKLDVLEKIIHPYVISQIKNEYNKVKNKNFAFFVVEIPLLFETGFQKYFNIVITISAKEVIAKKKYKCALSLHTLCNSLQTSSNNFKLLFLSSSKFLFIENNFPPCPALVLSI